MNDEAIREAKASVFGQIIRRLDRLEACVLELVGREEDLYNMETFGTSTRFTIPGPWDELRKEKEDEKVE